MQYAGPHNAFLLHYRSSHIELVPRKSYTLYTALLIHCIYKLKKKYYLYYCEKFHVTNIRNKDYFAQLLNQ